MSIRSGKKIALFATLLACTAFVPTGIGRADTPASWDVVSAKVWIGLKNSDDVGTKLDVDVRAYDADGNLTAAAIDQIEGRGVWAGSSGFNNARLLTIQMPRLLPGFGQLVPGVPARVEVYVRIACLSPGHRSASVILWYNGLPIDKGKGADAGSRISYEVFDQFSATNEVPLYLRPGAVLGTPGTNRRFVELKLSGPPKGQVCAEFKSFGTWETEGD